MLLEVFQVDRGLLLPQPLKELHVFFLNHAVLTVSLFLLDVRDVESRPGQYRARGNQVVAGRVVHLRDFLVVIFAWL